MRVTGAMAAVNSPIVLDRPARSDQRRNRLDVEGVTRRIARNRTDVLRCARGALVRATGANGSNDDPLKGC
jgi:hypothetical protein